MRVTRRLIGLGLVLGLAARPVTGGDLRDLYFGEALYHAYQGQFFDAIQRLDTELAMYHGLDEPGLDTLHFHVNDAELDRKSTRLNSSHRCISYAVFCLKKKKRQKSPRVSTPTFAAHG